jgi:hypothetical protein
MESNQQGPSKAEQLANTGKKAVEGMKNMASNAGSKIKSLISNKGEVPKLTDNQIKSQKMETQVLFFMFLFIGILVFVGLIFVSKTFRVYTSLRKLEIYKSNEINPKSIIETYAGSLGEKNSKISI